MTPYTDRDLEAMLSDIESDLVERKESLRGGASKTIRQAVCAFANDLPDHRRPGIVFVGVADNGRPVGADVTDDMLLQLGGIKADGNIVPPPTMEVHKLRVSDHEVAVVTVHPSDAPPVRYDGRIWIRVGPRRAIASVQDERILNEKRRFRDAHFDAQPVREATLGDLDLMRFDNEYLPNAIDAETLALNQRSTEERLAVTKMIVAPDDPTPTVAGILVLGLGPQDFLPGAYARFLRFDGNNSTDDVIDTADCSGCITDVIRQLEEKIVAHNRTRVDFRNRFRERRESSYPSDALRQLVRNAIMHRTYEGTNAPVRLNWFDDRIEIISPGGPYGVVNVDNFGESGAADYRNPIIAEAMRVLGMVQRYGLGIDLARKALKDNGNPEIDFQVNPNWVHCVVKARP